MRVCLFDTSAFILEAVFLNEMQNDSGRKKLYLYLFISGFSIHIHDI